MPIDIVILIVSIVVGLAGLNSRIVIDEKFGYIECIGWYIDRGSAAEISVAKCLFKILALRTLIRVLVNMTNLQISTRLRREIGIAKGAERGM